MRSTNGRAFGEDGNPRSAAELEAAISRLEDLGLVESQGFQREVFKVTASGYRLSDYLQAPPEEGHC
jgi:hypothetical protein